ADSIFHKRRKFRIRRKASGRIAYRRPYLRERGPFIGFGRDRISSMVSTRCRPRRSATDAKAQAERQRAQMLVYFGRGSWIRTNDLQSQKLPRYQAALYPDLATELHASPAASKAERPLSACRTRGERPGPPAQFRTFWPCRQPLPAPPAPARPRK